MRRKIILYNPNLKEKAKELRNSSTLSEILLWKYLKSKKLQGYDFHRQKPVDNYIVDFYCPDLMLAIEIDGVSHESKEVADKIRQKRLGSLGISVLRFTDSDVKKNMEGVLNVIENWIDNNTPPNPLSRGDLKHTIPSLEGNKGWVNNSGQTLVEIILAIGIASIVIVGLAILAASALKGAQEAIRKTESAKFANAGVEAALFHKNTQTFSSIVSGCYELEFGGGGTILQPMYTPCDANPNNNWDPVISPTTGLAYERRIQITINGNDMNVVSTIRWSDTQAAAGQFREVSVPRLITNWK